VGKKIRCKHCQQVFEITLHPAEQDIMDEALTDFTSATPDTPDTASVPSSEPAAVEAPAKAQQEQPNEREETAPKPERPATDNNKAAKESGQKSGKKINLQLLITIVLALTLILGGLGSYLYFYQPALFSDSDEQAAKTVIPHDLVKPAVAPDFKAQNAADHETENKAPASTGKSTTQANSGVKKISTITGDKDHPSQVCKDASADYWFRTRKLATVQLDVDTYMKLLQQNVDQAAEIRNLCPDRSLLGKITEAAKHDKQPKWIKSEISARIMHDASAQKTNSKQH